MNRASFRLHPTRVALLGLAVGIVVGCQGKREARSSPAPIDIGACGLPIITDRERIAAADPSTVTPQDSTRVRLVGRLSRDMKYWTVTSACGGAIWAFAAFVPDESRCLPFGDIVIIEGTAHQITIDPSITSADGPNFTLTDFNIVALADEKTICSAPDMTASESSHR